MEEKKVTKALDAFSLVKKEAEDTYRLYGDNLLVELLFDSDEVKTKGGITIAGGSQRQVNSLNERKATFAKVLLVGEGYYDTDEEGEAKSIPLDVEPGDIILVGRQSPVEFAQFGELVLYGQFKLGLVRESEILMLFRGQEAYDQFFKVLDKGLE